MNGTLRSVVISRDLDGLPPPEVVRDRPRAWSWERYEEWLSARFSDLLENGDPLDEALYHTFLEQHPCLLPGGEGAGESFGGHHGAFPWAVFSKPLVPSHSRRYPDFMWLTKNSGELIPVLIEIEAPGKPYFNRDGTRTALLTQAQDQVGEWKQLLDNPATRQQFADLYGFPARWAVDHAMAPRFLLVYGRRKEIMQPHRQARRAALPNKPAEVMTYDRLRPMAGSRHSVTARTDGTSTRVIAIPPTFQLGPPMEETLAAFTGWEEAIQVNDLIGPERKQFLLSRLSYWQGRGGWQGRRTVQPEPAGGRWE